MTQRTRDQARAHHAYRCVAAVTGKKLRDDYKVRVNSFGSDLMRSGLAATLASIERERAREGRGPSAASLFLDHLAAANVPGLKEADGEHLPAAVRELGVDEYMLATREMLKLAAWFRRAVQATFAPEDG